MDELKRIKAEEERLSAIFSALDENELQVVKGLISQAAFMLITLENLQQAIQKNGSVGEYKNGKDQYGTKQSAELQAYNQTLRSYNSVIGKLLKLVPRVPVHEETLEEKWYRIQKENDANKMTAEEQDAWYENFCRQLEEDRRRRGERNGENN